jgi:hypothetical protein
MGSVYSRAVRSPSRGLAAGALVALGACSQGDAPPDPKLWTLFDVQALYAEGAPATHGLAPNDGLPGGIPLGQLLALSMGQSALVGRNAWEDDYQTTYVTTEVWSSFDRVWMQPAYVPVTGWTGGTPQPLDAGTTLRPIFSVGPHSGFYSPFWQIVYALVPGGTAPGSVTSARQILDAGYSLTPSEGRTMPLTPDGITGGGNPGSGWLDGAPISFLDFGTATFSWDAENVVQELPLFVFTVFGDDGQPHVLSEMPKVLGTTPPGLGGGPPPNIGPNGGQPRYSAFWRIYTVAVPPFATIFAPPGSPIATDMVAQGIPTSNQYSDAIMAVDPTQLAPYIGRLTVDLTDSVTGLPACFATPTGLGTCHWIEVQAELEANLDASTTQATGITVTCPVIEAAATPVVPL